MRKPEERLPEVIAWSLERSLLLQIEVLNIAWSLVTEPDATDATSQRQWKSLTPAETMDVFDRLLRAASRHAKSAIRT